MNHKDSAQPYVEPDLVADKLYYGYWLEAVDINGDGKPEPVASGLAEGEIVWYENPDWKKHPIATFDKPGAKKVL
jgi:hypothetical protein